MFEEFDYDDHSQSFQLQCFFYEIVDVNFGKLSSSYKKELIERVDDFVSEFSNLPRANFIYRNGRSDNSKDLFMGNIDTCNNGIKFLYNYFFQKRLQYQRLCVENNYQGVYDSKVYSGLETCYIKSPITKSDAYIPYNENSECFYLNINNYDASKYAALQVNKILTGIDLNKKFSSYSSFERAKFMYMFKSVLSRVSKIYAKISEKCDNDRSFNSFFKKAERQAEKINNELYFSEYIHRNITNLEDCDSSVFAFFNSNLWENLDYSHRVLVVEQCNRKIASIVNENLKNIDFSSKDIFSFDEFCVFVGDLNVEDSKEILKAILVSYTYSFIFNLIDKSQKTDEEKIKYIKDIENFKKNIDNPTYAFNKSEFVSDLNKVYKRLQSLIYNSVSNIYGGNIEELFGKKREFVCNAIDSSTNTRRK